MAFSLHPKLAEDTLPIVELALCDVLLMNDRRFPWCILVPRLDNLRELHEIPDPRQAALYEEISATSRALERVVGAEKINVAALGNIVAQLHIHVIARFSSDAAWPAPVWGFGSAEPYPEPGIESHSESDSRPSQSAQSLIGALITQLRPRA